MTTETLVWLVLCGLSVTAAVLSTQESVDLLRPGIAAGLILAIAFVKVGLVVWRFMELHALPRAWQLAFMVWGGGLFALMLAGYHGLLFSAIV